MIKEWSHQIREGNKLTDPYFIRIKKVYDLQKTVIIKAVMEWREVFTAGEMSLTLKDLKFRLSQADSINENKEEYLKAINEVEKEIEIKNEMDI